MVITTWLFAADSLSSKVRAEGFPHIWHPWEGSGVVYEEMVSFFVRRDNLVRFAIFAFTAHVVRSSAAGLYVLTASLPDYL